MPILAVLVALGMEVPSHCQGRTDIVTLPNGDRVTGEVVRLDRGRLEFKTDDAGTIYLEWDKVATLVAARQVEVITIDGRQFLGTLGASAARTLSLVGVDGTTSLQMMDVTSIRVLGRSFWERIEFAVDAGYSYTRSSGVGQLNLHLDTLYRQPYSVARAALSVTRTRQDEGDRRDDRASLALSYGRYVSRRWFVAGLGRVESNESVGVKLRSQVAAIVGPRLINSNRAQLLVGAGAAGNDERGVEVEPTQNVEGLVALRGSFYTYDRPKTSLDGSLDYYSSFSNPGRRRLQIDAAVRRELWKDFFIALTFYHTFDNRPPNPAASSNDVGIVASIGWSY